MKNETKNMTIEYVNYLLGRLTYFEEKEFNHAAGKGEALTINEIEELKTLYQILGHLRAVAVAEIAVDVFENNEAFTTYVAEKKSLISQSLQEEKEQLRQEMMNSGGNSNAKIEELKKSIAHKTWELDKLNNMNVEEFVKYLIAMQGKYTSLDEISESLTRSEEYTATALNKPYSHPFIDLSGEVKVPTAKLAIEVLDGNYRNYNLIVEKKDREKMIEELNHTIFCDKFKRDNNSIGNSTNSVALITEIFYAYNDSLWNFDRARTTLVSIQKEYDRKGIFKSLDHGLEAKLDSAKRNYERAKKYSEELKELLATKINVLLATLNEAEVNTNLIFNIYNSDDPNYSLARAIAKAYDSLGIEPFPNAPINLSLRQMLVVLKERVDRLNVFHPIDENTFNAIACLSDLEAKFTKAVDERLTVLKKELEAHVAQIPSEYLNVDPSDLSRITYFGRGRIGRKEDYSFNKARAILRAIILFSEAKKDFAQKKGDESYELSELEAIREFLIDDKTRPLAENILNNAVQNGSIEFSPIANPDEDTQTMGM